MNSENNTFIAHISHLPPNITTKSILQKLSNDGKFVFKDYDFNNLRRYVNITFETQEEYDDFFKYILELSPPKEDSEKKEKITDYSQLKIAKYVPKEERGRTMEVGGNKKQNSKSPKRKNKRSRSPPKNKRSRSPPKNRRSRSPPRRVPFAVCGTCPPPPPGYFNHGYPGQFNGHNF